MFKFHFDIDDLDEHDVNPSSNSDPGNVVDLIPDVLTSEAQHQFEQPEERFIELHLEHLLAELPDAISYSPISIQLSSREEPLTLVRRDLFDARFQLISENAAFSHREQSDVNIPEGPSARVSALSFVDAPSDLIPGVYEGGLKTWECSVDLVDYLDRKKNSVEYGGFSGKKIIDVGCGTGLPILYILHEIFHKQPTDESTAAETQLHLQDYNASVLELVTLPNLILAWYISPASIAFRKAVNGEEKISLPDVNPLVPSELPITPALKIAFLSTLKAFNVTIGFFAGSWAYSERLNVQGNGILDKHRYDIVLTSETIYRNDNLPSLINFLATACGVAAGQHSEFAPPLTPSPISTPASSPQFHERTTHISFDGSTSLSGPISYSGGIQIFSDNTIRNEITREDRLIQKGPGDGLQVVKEGTPLTPEEIRSSGRNSGYTCLVAAKVLYFGVGGGVDDFVRRIEDADHDGGRVRGRVDVVWESCQSGVRRKIMQVRWI